MAQHEFKVLDSTLLLDAPILAVRRDTVTMPGGGSADREVVEHMGAVAVVALNESNQVAMVQQYRHSVGARLWELPAGLLDIKDEAPVIAAQRELAEEAGLKASDWELLTDLVTSPGFCEETVRIFLARGLSETDKLEDTGDEEADMDFAWVDLDDAVARVFSGDIVNSIAIAGILGAHAVVTGAAHTRSADSEFPLRPTSIAQRRPGPDLKKL